MYTLRPFQVIAKQDCLEYDYKVPGIAVLPTGAGKSLLISEIIEGRTLIFQPTEELLTQNYEKYLEYGFEASIYSASKNSKEIGKVTFATINSIYNQPELTKNFDFIIIDECHTVPYGNKSMYSKFLKYFKGKILGLTATPFRLKQATGKLTGNYSYMDMQTGRGELFKKIFHITQVKDVLEYWSPLVYHEYVFDISKIKLNKGATEFDLKSVVAEMNRQKVVEKIVTETNNIAQYRNRILVYVPTVEMAETIAKLTNGEMVEANTHKKDRRATVERFRNGKTKVLVNVGIFQLGFNVPEVDCIVIGRPTMSFTWYYQVVGRGVRQHPSKKDCLILDLSGLVKRFGKIEQIKFGDRYITSGYRKITYSDLSGLNYAPRFHNGIHRFKKVTEVPEEYLEYIWQHGTFKNDVEINGYLESKFSTCV